MAEIISYINSSRADDSGQLLGSVFFYINLLNSKLNHSGKVFGMLFNELAM
jgi:hypothetical protein